MSHKDRNHVQVPRNLPPWLDGPRVRVEMERLGCSEDEARYILKHIPRKQRKK